MKNFGNDDMERFYDPCDDGRTNEQILWEEGICREGSLRQKWEYNFGENGFYKFGKKIASILLLAMFWVGISIIVDNCLIRGALQTLFVVFINAASIWLFRQTQAYKGFTKLNVIYIICCTLFTLVFYKYMNSLFGYWGHAVFLSLYYGIYFMSKNVSVIVRIIISLWVIYNAVRYNRGNGIYDTINVILSIAAVVIGFICRYFASYSNVIYYMVLFSIMLIAIVGFLLYVITKNKFMRNIILVFSFISFMEVLGSRAVFTGAMDNYIKNGMW